MRCEHCKLTIRPNETGGYFHPETGDQKCRLYATPERGDREDV